MEFFRLCIQNRDKAIRHLRKGKANKEDIAYVTKDGTTLLHIAAMINDVELVRMFAFYVPLPLVYDFEVKRDIYILAIKNDSTDVVKALIDAKLDCFKSGELEKSDYVRHSPSKSLDRVALELGKYDIAFLFITERIRLLESTGSMCLGFAWSYIMSIADGIFENYKSDMDCNVWLMLLGILDHILGLCCRTSDIPEYRDEILTTIITRHHRLLAKNLPVTKLFIDHGAYVTRTQPSNQSFMEYVFSDRSTSDEYLKYIALQAYRETTTLTQENVNIFFGTSWEECCISTLSRYTIFYRFRLLMALLVSLKHLFSEDEMVKTGKTRIKNHVEHNRRRNNRNDDIRKMTSLYDSLTTKNYALFDRLYLTLELLEELDISAQ